MSESIITGEDDYEMEWPAWILLNCAIRLTL